MALTLTLPRTAALADPRCRDCSGAGFIRVWIGDEAEYEPCDCRSFLAPGTNAVACPDCDGRGGHEVISRSGWSIEGEKPCCRCHGLGKVRPESIEPANETAYDTDPGLGELADDGIAW